MNNSSLNINNLHDSYSRGKTTPQALIFSLRAQAVRQSEYNAWIYLLSEDELEPYISRLDGESPTSLPLYGIPFAIKDNIDLAHVPTTAACPDFSYIPSTHAPVVAALIEAGAIPLGKTNLDQFATGLVGTRSPYGQGKNTFNQEYISGGSSAGSAIATALGQVTFALGTDTAGSGRVPAALNNLIGHKPTKGLLSTSGVVPACRTLDCVSIFALTCNDAAAVLDVAAQYDATDPYARPNTYQNKKRYYRGNTPTAFTFGVPTILDFQGNNACAELYKQSIDALISMGGTAVAFDFEPFTAAAKLLYEGPWVAERWLATKGVEPASMLDVIQNIIGTGNKASAPDAFAAQYRLAELKKICDAAIQHFDFVLTPTIPTIYTRAEIDEQPIARNSVLGTYTNFMNLLDYSATAVPVGATPSGVHWGVTLFSFAFNDIQLLNYAGAIQNHFGLSMGATGIALDIEANTHNAIPHPQSTIDVVVCGAHLKGQPLNWQLTERGATFKSLTTSSANYSLFALPDGKRPAMVRNKVLGAAIEVEVWTMPSENFGSFVAGIPAPLGIGKVELADGQWLSGFICDGFGLEGAEDISSYTSWRMWLKR